MVMRVQPASVIRFRAALASITALSLASVSSAQTSPADSARQRAAIEQILGRTGAAQPGGVVKFSFARSDLKVVADGVTLKPAFALGGWVAFKKTGSGQTMAMGDLVLTEDEVSPVMLSLQKGGVEQTAVHNHLLNESPRIVYVHIFARGDETRIATAIQLAIAETGTPLLATSAPTAAVKIDLDTAGIARTLGITGKVNGGVYQVSVPRPEKITDDGEEVPPSMGTSTSINFQSVGRGRAAITGDFVLVAGEVNPVIRALQSHGIRTTALHSHMLMENPRLYFMHFWARDDALALARGLRAALDEMSPKKASSGN
jgi:hypothetical protein